MTEDEKEAKLATLRQQHVLASSLSNISVVDSNNSNVSRLSNNSMSNNSNSSSTTMSNDSSSSHNNSNTNVTAADSTIDKEREGQNDGALHKFIPASNTDNSNITISNTSASMLKSEDVTEASAQTVKQTLMTAIQLPAIQSLVTQ